VTPTPTRPVPHYSPLTGQAFITTLGSGGGNWCLWNYPLGLPGHNDRVTCRKHGTPVEIVQSAWVIELGNTGCYYYLVKTEGGFAGWIGEYALTQDLNQPPRDCSVQPIPMPPYQ